MFAVGKPVSQDRPERCGYGGEDEMEHFWGGAGRKGSKKKQKKPQQPPPLLSLEKK